jgi:hypothetical protein
LARFGAGTQSVALLILTRCPSRWRGGAGRNALVLRRPQGVATIRALNWLGHAASVISSCRRGFLAAVSSNSSKTPPDKITSPGRGTADYPRGVADLITALT